MITPQDIEVLLAAIDKVKQKHGYTEQTLGMYAVKNPRFVIRLREGKGCTPRIYMKALEWAERKLASEIHPSEFYDLKKRVDALEEKWNTI